MSAQFARHSKPCVLATLDGEIVLLPPSSTAWLLSHPDTILSADEARKRTLQTKYTFPRPEIVDRPVHHDILNSELTSQTLTVTPEVCDELRAAVDQIWAEEPDSDLEDDEDEERERVGKGGWKTVVLSDSMTNIVARVSNRVFVGLPLCEYSPVRVWDAFPYLSSLQRKTDLAACSPFRPQRELSQERDWFR
jgi:hypothetical protein